MKMKTEKITVSLSADTLKLANKKYSDFGFSSRSEFINAAIKEYISRDLLKQFSGEIAAIYKKIERSEIAVLEEHLSKLAYKVAVEMAQINLILASELAIDSDDIRRLRGKAVGLVNELKGFVPLGTANKNV